MPIISNFQDVSLPPQLHIQTHLPAGQKESSTPSEKFYADTLRSMSEVVETAYAQAPAVMAEHRKNFLTFFDVVKQCGGLLKDLEDVGVIRINRQQEKKNDDLTFIDYVGFGFVLSSFFIGALKLLSYFLRGFASSL